MRVLSETASTLTIDYPLWMGLASLVVGYALAGWLIKSAKGSRKPVQHVIAGVGGFIIVSIVGFSALTDYVALDATGARESRLFHQSSASWTEVVEVTVEERRSRRSMNPHLVLKKTHGEWTAEITGLSAQEVERVLAFARRRIAGR